MTHKPTRGGRHELFDGNCCFTIHDGIDYDYTPCDIWGRTASWTADVESERLGKKRSEDLSDYSVEAFDE